MILPGEIYHTEFDEIGPHPIVVVSREELNRGRWVSAVLITSKRFEVRAKLSHNVPFRAGEFGLSADCVAQCESHSSVRREDLGDRLGRLDDGRWREIVKAVGAVMGSDCDPSRRRSGATSEPPKTSTGDEGPEPPTSCV